MRFGGLALLIGYLFAPRAAGAQDCVPPLPDLYPADGARAVPVNGVVRVVFHEPYAPELTLEEVLRLYESDSGALVPGTVTLATDGPDTTVELVTDAPLASTTDYRATVVLPEFGGEREFFFRTGEGVLDTSPPVFHGASGIRVVPASDVSCSDATGPVPPQEAELGDSGKGYRVTVSFPQADDEAGPANIDYLLVQTSGPTLDGPWLRKRVRTWGDTLFGAVFLPRAAVAREEICFAVHAEDMFGNRVEPGREACGDPIGPGYFQSMCAVAAVGARAPALPGVLVLAALLSAVRRRSRRRSSRRPGP